MFLAVFFLIPSCFDYETANPSYWLKSFVVRGAIGSMPKCCIWTHFTCFNLFRLKTNNNTNKQSHSSSVYGPWPPIIIILNYCLLLNASSAKVLLGLCAFDKYFLDQISATSFFDPLPEGRGILNSVGIVLKDNIIFFWFLICLILICVY